MLGARTKVQAKAKLDQVQEARGTERRGAGQCGWRSGAGRSGNHNRAGLLWVSTRFEREWRQKWLQFRHFCDFLLLFTAL